MRRRHFMRVCVSGLGSLAVGCQGQLFVESARSSDAARPTPDAGPAVRLLPGEDAGRRDAGRAPPADLPDARPPPAPDAGPPAGDAGGDDCPERRVLSLHDVHAQALYFDGTQGPTTGVVTVDDIVAGEPLELPFWHGHGGANHRFDVSAADLERLMRGERITLVTSEVDGHRHMLFIDPVGEPWRAGPERSVEVC